MNVWAYVAIAAIFLGYSYWLVDIGYGRCQAEQLTAEKEQLKTDAKHYEEVIKPLEKKRGKTIGILKAKLRKTAQANKGCYKLTDPLPADFVDELRKSYNAITRPPAN